MYLKKYIPTYFYKTIYDIDYNFLKQSKIKTLLFDLDNTILNYNQYGLNSEQKKFFNMLLKDFNICIITNASKKRLEKAIDEYIDGISNCRKPFKYKVEKIMNEKNFSKLSTCIIGDQLISDISLGNKLGLKFQILVKPINKSTEKLPTKINRFREKIIKYFIKKGHIDIYNKLIKEH